MSRVCAIFSFSLSFGVKMKIMMMAGDETKEIFRDFQPYEIRTNKRTKDHGTNASLSSIIII